MLDKSASLPAASGEGEGEIMGDKIGWPSAFVGAVLLIMIGAIEVTAVIRYTTVDDALKIWTGMSAVIGVVTGAFVSYFFTRGTVQQAQQAVQQAQQSAQQTQQQLQQAQKDADDKDERLARLNSGFAALSGHVEPHRFEVLAKEDAAVRRALEEI